MLSRTLLSLAVAGLLAMVTFSSPVLAVDQPIDGKALRLKRTAKGDKLVFVSKDARFAFPALGSLDDPTIGGLQVELFSAGESISTSAMAPAGLGKPGWIAKSEIYRYRNALAPGGDSPIKVAILRQGKRIRIVTRNIGLSLLAPQSGVGIRLTLGSLRLCAMFDTATIKKDDAGSFFAKDASAASLADCTNASLGVPFCEGLGSMLCGGPCPGGSVCAPDVNSGNFDECVCISESGPCGGTSPVCNGQCGVGEVCLAQGSLPFTTCGCFPENEPPCDGTVGLCGGACPAGQVCSFVETTFDSGCRCGGSGACFDIGGIECPPGFFCGIASQLIVCAPLECGGGGPYPTCGGDCGPGLECAPVALTDQIGGPPFFEGCLCAAPGICDPVGMGLECPAGEVCVVNDAFTPSGLAGQNGICGAPPTP